VLASIDPNPFGTPLTLIEQSVQSKILLSVVCSFVTARRISGTRKGSGAGGGGHMTGAKMWSSMGDMLEGQDETDEKRRVNCILTTLL